MKLLAQNVLVRMLGETVWTKSKLDFNPIFVCHLLGIYLCIYIKHEIVKKVM